MKAIGCQHGEMAGEVDPIWVAIRARRIERGLGIAELGALAHVSTSTISRGERGYGTTISVVRRVAAAVGLVIEHAPSVDVLDDLGDAAFERSQDQ